MTEKLETNEKLHHEYRNKISHVYKFLELKYLDYYEVGVIYLTEEDKTSPDQFWNKNDRDIVYAGLNIETGNVWY